MEPACSCSSVLSRPDHLGFSGLRAHLRDPRIAPTDVVFIVMMRHFLLWLVGLRLGIISPDELTDP